ncbi:MAG: hypothetical protein EOP83_07905 [Verrucomicrobiaceae bacterium]|nr:MAG: hypothetical protein EOP83_07905 [Verrucomicrobiaceae bacterium]
MVDETPRFFQLSRSEGDAAWNFVLHRGVYTVTEGQRTVVREWCRENLGPHGIGNWVVLESIFSMHTQINATAFKLRWL